MSEAGPAGTSAGPRPPDSVICVGAGTMGAGIALAFALGGSAATMVTRRQPTLDAAWRRIEASVTLLADAGRLPGAEREAVLGRITGTTDLDGADLSADLVVESVAEDVAAKLRLYRAIEPRLGPLSILGTCTSSLSLAELAAGLTRPERFLGYHWFNPPELVALVEIVPAGPTAAAVTDRVEAYSRAIGKQPVRMAADVPGFVANRLQYALIREAYHLVASGVCTAADVDRVITAGLGPRWAAIGPFLSMDLAGLDVHRAVAEQLFPRLSAATTVPPALTALIEEGALGVKSGRGLLGRYDEEGVREVMEVRARVLLMLHGLGLLPRPVRTNGFLGAGHMDRGVWSADDVAGRSYEDQGSGAQGRGQGLGDHRAGPGPAPGGRGADPVRGGGAVPFGRSPAHRRHPGPLPDRGRA
jgi:3-hydroxybutyryl-CoA dehydrogenase